MQITINKKTIIIILLALFVFAVEGFHAYVTYKLVDRVTLHEMYLTQIVKAIQDAEREQQEAFPQ